LDQKLRWIQPPPGRIQGSPTTGTRWGNGVAIAQPSVSGPGVAVTTTIDLTFSARSQYSNYF
jgi:hypothetical protein